MDFYIYTHFLLALTVSTSALGTWLPVSSRSRSNYWTRTTKQLGNPYGCPALRNPENGEVQVEGMRASYTCDDGFTLIGLSKRTCFCGKWLHHAPECVADGQWGPWSCWTQCSSSCGKGWRTRQRSCRSLKYDREGEGEGCVGEALERSECDSPPCTDTGKSINYYILVYSRLSCHYFPLQSARVLLMLPWDRFLLSLAILTIRGL
jgi:hypothetical protein